MQNNKEQCWYNLAVSRPIAAKDTQRRIARFIMKMKDAPQAASGKGSSMRRFRASDNKGNETHKLQ